MQKQKTLLAEDNGHFSMIRHVFPRSCCSSPFACSSQATIPANVRCGDRALHLADLITELNGKLSPSVSQLLAPSIHNMVQLIRSAIDI